MPATLNQLIRIAGGARVYYKGVYFYTKDDITVAIYMDKFDAENQFGSPVPLLQRRRAEISFTPYGTVAAADLAALYKYARWTGTGDNNESVWWGAAQPGDVLYPKTGGTTALLGDLVIDPLRTTNNKQWTFYRCEVEKPPELTLSMTKTLLGQVTIQCYGLLEDGTNTDFDTNILFSHGTANAIAANYFSPTATVDRFSGAWGSIVTGMYSEDGFTFSVDPQLEDVPTDGFAIPCKLVTGVKASVKCKIQSLTDAQVATLIDASNAAGGLGSSMVASAMLQTLTITGASAATQKLVLNNARVFSVSPTWSLTNARSGELVFENVRQITNNALVDVFDLSTWV